MSDLTLRIGGSCLLEERETQRSIWVQNPGLQTFLSAKMELVAKPKSETLN